MQKENSISKAFLERNSSISNNQLEEEVSGYSLREDMSMAMKGNSDKISYFSLEK